MALSKKKRDSYERQLNELHDSGKISDRQYNAANQALNAGCSTAKDLNNVLKASKEPTSTKKPTTTNPSLSSGAQKAIEDSKKAGVPAGTTTVDRSQYGKWNESMSSSIESTKKTINTLQSEYNKLQSTDTSSYSDQQRGQHLAAMKALEEAEARARAAEENMRKLQEQAAAAIKAAEQADENVKALVISVTTDELRISTLSTSNSTPGLTYTSYGKTSLNNKGVVGDSIAEADNFDVAEIYAKQNSYNSINVRDAVFAEKVAGNGKVTYEAMTETGPSSIFEAIKKYNEGREEGSYDDMLANKTFEGGYIDENGVIWKDGGKRLFGTGTEQDKIQKKAKTDEETGIRFVDGAEVGLDGEKIFTVAMGDIVASNATGEPRVGDVFKVTWADGTSDYVCIGDTKGGYLYGHDNRYTEENNYTGETHENLGDVANAMELIIDKSVNGAVSKNIAKMGTLNKNQLEDPMVGALDRTTGCATKMCDNEVLMHWAQTMTNIEPVDANVLGL